MFKSSQLLVKHSWDLFEQGDRDPQRRGTHYTSLKFIQLVENSALRRSMSRRGNCWDNAPQESFFGHMKDELASEIPGWTSFEPPKPPLTAGWITTTTTAASGIWRSYPLTNITTTSFRPATCGPVRPGDRGSGGPGRHRADPGAVHRAGAMRTWWASSALWGRISAWRRSPRPRRPRPTSADTAFFHGVRRHPRRMPNFFCEVSAF